MDVSPLKQQKGTWRHHSVGVVHVEGRHVSDSKSISRVNVWEADGSLWNSYTQFITFPTPANTFSFSNPTRLTWTMPGSAATFPICFMAGRNPPTPERGESKHSQTCRWAQRLKQPRRAGLTSSSTGVTKLLEYQFLQGIVHVEVSFNLKTKKPVSSFNAVKITTLTRHFHVNPLWVATKEQICFLQTSLNVQRENIDFFITISLLY